MAEYFEVTVKKVTCTREKRGVLPFLRETHEVIDDAVVYLQKFEALDVRAVIAAANGGAP